MGWKESTWLRDVQYSTQPAFARWYAAKMLQFKIGDRIRIIKPDIDHECRKGQISAVESSEELDRMEMRDEKFAQFRGYTVKLDTGHTKLYIAMDIEADLRTTGVGLRLQIL